MPVTSAPPAPTHTIIRRADCKDVPWKNGKGVTRDVVMLPEGSSHSDFDFRVSRAPITDEGPFSTFAGVDRWITLISGSRLILDFPDGSHLMLDRLKPRLVDAAAGPDSRLPRRPVVVLNVMTRRTRWTTEVMILRGGSQHELPMRRGAFLFVHAVKGEWGVCEAASTTLFAEDSGLWSARDPLSLRGQPAAEAIVAVVNPAST